MKFNNEKYKVLPLQWTNLLAGHRLGTPWLGSSSAGKALGVEWAASWTRRHSMPWQQRGHFQVGKLLIFPVFHVSCPKARAD